MHFHHTPEIWADFPEQSSLSAVRADTTTVLIVAEALHESAEADVRALITALADQIEAVWSTNPVEAVLSGRFTQFATPG